MSDTTFVATRPDFLRPVKAIAFSVLGFLETIYTAIQVAHRYDELDRLSDAALEKRGLTRAGLAQKAWSEFN